jgi:hypothetical protein
MHENNNVVAQNQIGKALKSMQDPAKNAFETSPLCPQRSEEERNKNLSAPGLQAEALGTVWRRVSTPSNQVVCWTLQWQLTVM